MNRTFKNGLSVKKLDIKKAPSYSKSRNSDDDDEDEFKSFNNSKRDSAFTVKPYRNAKKSYSDEEDSRRSRDFSLRGGLKSSALNFQKDKLDSFDKSESKSSNRQKDNSSECFLVELEMRLKIFFCFLE